MIKKIIRIIRPFLRTPQGKSAILMFLGTIVAELVFIYVNVQLNKWNVGFFNSIQDYNYSAFVSSIYKFFFIIFFLISAYMVKFMAAEFLMLYCRKHMTSNYCANWTKNFAFYGTKVIGKESDNPDQRIATNIDEFVMYLMPLVIGVVAALVTFFSFIFILWELSGTLDFTLFGTEYHIKGYLAYVAFLYSFVGTYVIHRIGKPLGKLYFEQEHWEADFRYALIRLRENADSIALYNSSHRENKYFSKLFSKIVDNKSKVIINNTKVNILITLYNNFVSILPLLFAAPKFFAQVIKFGALMQIRGAFMEIHTSFSYIVGSYTLIASLRAATNRLHGYQQTIEAWQKAAKKKPKVTKSSDRIKLSNFTLRLPNGDTLIENSDLEFREGNYIFQANNGVGKSTLLRAIAGVWPFSDGTIQLPKNKKSMFIPQKSYMPIGTLLEVISYPGNITSGLKAAKLLKELNLGKFISRLNQTDEWSRVLSGGEQQKIAIMRAILAKVDILFLDEAFSMMDEENARLTLEVLLAHLPNCQLISINHQKIDKKFFPNTFTINDKKLLTLDS